MVEGATQRRRSPRNSWPYRSNRHLPAGTENGEYNNKMLNVNISFPFHFSWISQISWDDAFSQIDFRYRSVEVMLLILIDCLKANTRICHLEIWQRARWYSMAMDWIFKPYLVNVNDCQYFSFLLGFEFGFLDFSKNENNSKCACALDF